MREKFVNKRLRAETREMISIIGEIVDEYEAQGYKLSLRQIYYRLIGLDLFPEDRRWRKKGEKWFRDPNGTKNADPNYKWLGTLVTNGRLTGLLDWGMIVDRGRKTEIPPHWGSPGDIIRSAALAFAIDKWEDQPCHVEVMAEKQALEGVLGPVCRHLDVNFTSNKGYCSVSTMYEVGQRLKEKGQEGKSLAILYLGDHDPSGLDMDRDVVRRLSRFSGYRVKVKRVALTMEQIEELGLSEDPAKLSDSRAHRYVRLYGYSSWELDAIDPKELARLVTEAVEELRDPDLWEEAEAREDEMRRELQEFADSYEGGER